MNLTILIGAGLIAASASQACWRSGLAHRCSTATDKFYPDFVAQLDDGRLLVVEYKGAYLAEISDTTEKRTIGQLWEQESGGRGLFLVVERTVDGKDMRTEMVEKIGG